MKKATKISLIVLAAVVSALAITVLILALVKSDFKQVSLDNYKFAEVYQGTTKTDTIYLNNQSEYAKMVELYNKSFDERVLVSLFTGAYKADTGVEEKTLSNVISSESSNYIVFTSVDEKTLVVNGKTYTNSSNQQVKFTRLIVELNASSSLETATIYIVDDTNSSDTTFVSYYRVNVIAKFAELNNYVNSL